MDCGILVRADRMYCAAHARKHQKFNGHKVEPRPLDWSARLCQLAERAALGIPLFPKHDKQQSDTDT